MFANFLLFFPFPLPPFFGHISPFFGGRRGLPPPNAPMLEPLINALLFCLGYRINEYQGIYFFVNHARLYLCFLIQYTTKQIVYHWQAQDVTGLLV